jgi:hypothetical protein
MKASWQFVTGLFLLAVPKAQAQFDYSTNGDTITVTQYTGLGGTVTISNFVTSIGVQAFIRCTNLTDVKIPDNVTSIGGGAFFQCSGLTNVSIGKSVTNIGDQAFEFGTSLLWRG